MFFFFFFFFLGGGGGYEEYLDIFGGSSGNWTIFLLSLGLLCILEPFLKVNVPNGIFCRGGAKISNIFWDMPDIPDIFRVTVDAGSKLTCIYTM